MRIEHEEDGMVQMSILEHLEELRYRIISALTGLAVAFFVSLTFCNELWTFIQQPARAALLALGVPAADAKLVITAPGEAFSIVWVKLPLIASLFLAAPWVMYQAWAFIAPGLYRRERRWGASVLLAASGLFLAGGLFAYFVAFRYGLTFLLSISMNIDARTMLSITEYFDLFCDVILGVSLAFEMPVVIFLLTLLRLASPRFLLRHSRYAILAITILAAVLTPTFDAMNMMLFALPMCALYFVGLLASYVLVLKREQRSLPWRPVWVGGAALVLAGGGVYLVSRRGYRLAARWPFLRR